MNGREAIKKDRVVVDPFYVELDEGTGLYCVFGSESGFAYSSHASESQAQGVAQQRNDDLRVGLEERSP